MAMLERYRKPGGFVQLLTLIETCAPLKQQKLLETVAKEDAVWADAIRSKMINIERVFSWNDEALAEIIGTLQDLTVAVTIQAAQEPLKSRLLALVSHGRRRKIDDTYGAKTPTEAEVAAMHMKILEHVRKMGNEGYLRFEKFDPPLVIDEDIDDRLETPSGVTSDTSPATPTADAVGGSSAAPRVLHAYSPLAAHQAAQPAQTPPPPANEGGESRTIELQTLKKRVADLSKENAVLRHELSMAKSKLEQIKKIA